MNETLRLFVEKDNQSISVNFHFIPALLAISFVTSCSTVKDSVSKINNPLKGLAKLNKNDLLNFKLSDLRTNTPPIVKVRPEDLKQMKTGKERYLAYHREKELYYIGSADGIEFLPQDFDPNNLPTDFGLSSTGVLPPFNPGISSPIKKIPDLPAETEE